MSQYSGRSYNPMANPSGNRRRGTVNLVDGQEGDESEEEFDDDLGDIGYAEVDRVDVNL